MEKKLIEYMKVYLNHSENLHFIANVRDFTDIHTDEPESFHGTNKGPSPVEYFLIGIGGCIGSTFVFCCKKNNIEIEDISVTIDGIITHKEERENLLQFDRIEGKIDFIPKNVSKDEIAIKSCIKDFQKYCVVSNSIQQGIPMNVQVNWKQK